MKKRRIVKNVSNEELFSSHRKNLISTFRFTLDDGIKRGLTPLSQGKVFDQELVKKAWDIVVGEIMNACDASCIELSESAVIWLADAYFQRAIKLKRSDGTNFFDDVESTNNINISLLGDNDINTMNLHLKGSVFEVDINDEQKRRQQKNSN